MKLLLLNLDGTVRETISGKKFISVPNDQKLIAGVKEAIARYSGWTIVGITNQGGVAAGHKSLGDAIAEQHVTIQLLPELNWIYFCPTYDGKTCWKVDRFSSFEIQQFSVEEFGSFRKPGAGMINLALKKFDTEGFGAEELLYVGDRPEDEQAALAAGVPFMWAHEWRAES